MDEKTKLFLEKFKYLKALNDFNTLDQLYNEIIGYSRLVYNETPWLSRTEVYCIVSDLVKKQIMIQKIRGINKNNENAMYDSLDDYYKDVYANNGNWVYKIEIKEAQLENW